MRSGFFKHQLVLRPNVVSRRNFAKTDTLLVPFADTTTYQRVALYGTRLRSKLRHQKH